MQIKVFLVKMVEIKIRDRIEPGRPVKKQKQSKEELIRT
jgi:hypothetical protein